MYIKYKLYVSYVENKIFDLIWFESIANLYQTDLFIPLSSRVVGTQNSITYKAGTVLNH